MTVDDDGTSLEGVDPEVFGPQLAALPVDAVGVNCSVGPAPMLLAVEKLARHVPLPIAAQPNAGKPELVGSKVIFRERPEEMAESLPALLEAGARIVGACCGSTPAHIRALRAKLTKPLIVDR